MNYSQAFGSAGGGALLDYQLFTFSQQYAVPYDGLLDFLALAGCGSGALGSNYVTGAGAGETGISRGVRVYKGDVITVTVGRGGAPVTMNASNAAAGVPGNVGSDTVVSSNRGWVITVKGGRGGKVGPRGTQLAGALGGRNGSGAQLHIPGGDGGSILTTVNQPIITGGGAPNLRNVAASLVRGGDVSASALTDGVATGGAGVGGHGGDYNTGSSGITCGGGYGSSAPDNVNNQGGANALGKRVAASAALLVPELVAWGLDIFGGGAQAPQGNAGPGGGTAGAFQQVGMSDSNLYLNSFSGAGGCYAVADSGSRTLSAAPIGCTSASAYGLVISSYTSTSGQAGQGLVVFILRKG